MPQRSPACPDCKVPMDSGFIVDFTGSEFSKQSSWAEGTAKRNFWGSVVGDRAAATDCDISLPEVRSTEIIRAGDLARVAAAERLVRCVASFASAQPLCRATVRPPSSLEISRVTNRGSPWGNGPVPGISSGNLAPDVNRIAVVSSSRIPCRVSATSSPVSTVRQSFRRTRIRRSMSRHAGRADAIAGG